MAWPHRIALSASEASAGGAASVLDRAFDVPSGSRFFDDFPIWDPRHQVGAKLYCAMLGDKVVATAGIRIAKSKPFDRLDRPRRVAIIGAVASDPDHRGEGHARACVDAAFEEAARSGAEVLVLWTTEPAFYRSYGLSPIGTQLQVPLGSLGLSCAAPDVSLIRRGWDPQLFPLLRSREGGLLLEPSDYLWIVSHRNVQWFWLARRIGSIEIPVAYAAVGRGIDLTGFVHEWGGERDALLELLAALGAKIPTLQLLAHPETLGRIGLGAQGESGPLCLGRWLSTRESAPPRFFERLWFWGLDSC